MKSQEIGISTSDVEVLNISAHGIWLYVGGTEYFLSYAEYPWFRDATVGHVLNVQLLHSTHLRWPDLDIDLDTDSLEHPEAYPLVFR
jgi:hypothetical protein